MNNKRITILIPDECENALSYYTARSLKAAKDEFKIYILTSSTRNSTNSSWLNFYKNSWYIDNLFFSEKTFGSIDYLADCLKTIKDNNIDLIFAASELGFTFVSQFRNQLLELCRLIALPSQTALHTAFNKFDFSIFLDTHGLPAPKTALLKDFKTEQFNFPILLKPIYGSGGKNIKKINNSSELKLNTEIESNILNNSYIIQEYINGFDIDCNVLCQKGKILTQTIQIPLGAAQNFSPKVDKLQFVHDPIVLDLVQRMMGKFEWSGVAHLDLRYSDQTGQLYVIEINPRFWQSLLGSLVAGVNFPYYLYLLSTGSEVELVDYQDKYYAKISRFVKDLLHGSLDCRLNDTNLKYLLTDPLATLFYGIETFLKRK
ncbi:ATP-grasp domain-containing protein [Merismopedia glauca]|uniref:ATP-utilizing enzyme (ATP-grasp superfamily) n=1 Tax=Merismopedia glauca CCAP 1448/3 TaxID=1296344 RepID=A0A2T1BX72_9CYAN|nr:ATP-grasp domain-containing protein [Merismopedia glauca]PSB00591.1 ATP-utilizing enzyme (ATP-grasp superfamily) [Merismopedia glauca CCAP 1448/3]